MQLTRNFTLAEFEAASHRRLTAAEVVLAQRWAVEVLQPARDRFGRIDVTSYVRAGDRVGAGCHADGRGLDFVPRASSIGQVHRFLANEAEAGRMPMLGEVLDERLANTGPHIHASVAPCGAPDGPEVLRLVGYNDDGRALWERGFARVSVLGFIVLLGLLALLFF